MKEMNADLFEIYSKLSSDEERRAFFQKISDQQIESKSIKEQIEEAIMPLQSQILEMQKAMQKNNSSICNLIESESNISAIEDMLNSDLYGFSKRTMELLISLSFSTAFVLNNNVSDLFLRKKSKIMPLMALNESHGLFSTEINRSVIKVGDSQHINFLSLKKNEAVSKYKKIISDKDKDKRLKNRDFFTSMTIDDSAFSSFVSKPEIKDLFVRYQKYCLDQSIKKAQSLVILEAKQKIQMSHRGSITDIELRNIIERVDTGEVDPERIIGIRKILELNLEVIQSLINFRVNPLIIKDTPISKDDADKNKSKQSEEGQLFDAEENSFSLKEKIRKKVTDAVDSVVVFFKDGASPKNTSLSEVGKAFTIAAIGGAAKNSAGPLSEGVIEKLTKVISSAIEIDRCVKDLYFYVYKEEDSSRTHLTDYQTTKLEHHKNFIMRSAYYKAVNVLQRQMFQRDFENKEIPESERNESVEKIRNANLVLNQLVVLGYAKAEDFLLGKNADVFDGMYFVGDYFVKNPSSIDLLINTMQMYKRIKGDNILTCDEDREMVMES